VSANELSAALWRERELLELLAFKLEEEHLLLTAGRTRWLQYATREVEQVVERLSGASLARSIAATSLAELWLAPHDATLRQLIEHAPDDTWREILTGHLAALTELTGQIRELRDGNERFLRQAARSAEETLAATDGAGSRYDATGGQASAARGGDLFVKDL
jgi:flagellar biosynthesis/type III secretory pathway chaperone